MQTHYPHIGNLQRNFGLRDLVDDIVQEIGFRVALTQARKSNFSKLVNTDEILWQPLCNEFLKIINLREAGYLPIDLTKSLSQLIRMRN